MKLKTIILIVGLMVFSCSAQSQTEGVSYWLHSGLNFQTFNGKNISGNQLDHSYVPRFNVGAMINCPITSKLFFKSGLLFTTKGSVTNDPFQGMNMSVEYNVAYFEIPLSLVYKMPLGNGRIFIGLGPYVSYGIVGNAAYSLANIKVLEKIKFTKQHDSLDPIDLNYLNPLDYGGNLIFGYELQSGFSFQLNTQQGMAKINSENTLLSSKATFKNTGYGFSVEYKF